MIGERANREKGIYMSIITNRDPDTMYSSSEKLQSPNRETKARMNREDLPNFIGYSVQQEAVIYSRHMLVSWYRIARARENTFRLF